jgi:hypothetical protein
MTNTRAITCQIRYTLDLSKLSVFERYARTWIVLVERYGGIHHGYFIPRATPVGAGLSFPWRGYDGRADVAIAMFTFPDEESYRRYREMVVIDPVPISRGTRSRDWLLRHERLFLEPAKRA